MPHTPAGRRFALLVLLAAGAPPAFPLGLGEAELRSALAEPLDLVIDIRATPGESLGPDCFRLAPAGPGGLPAISRAQFTVESGSRLRVRTTRPLNEPVTLLRLNASCPGGGLVTRDYPILLDPRPVAAEAPGVSLVTVGAKAVERPQGKAPSAPHAGPPTATVTTTLRSLPGDTLRGIATAIHPKHRWARDTYLDALREANPPLASLGPDEPIPADSAIALPDLKSFSKRVSRPADAGSPTRATTTIPAPTATPEPSAPKAAPPSRPTQAAPPSPTDTAPAARAPKPAGETRTREPARASGGFALRLSAPEVDLSRSRGIDDRTRAQLRERLLLLDADDQVAALLQMRHNLRQLEARVSELQLRLSGPLATAPSAAPAPREATPTPAAARLDAPKVSSPTSPPAPAAPVATPPPPERSSAAAPKAPAEPPSPAAPKAAPGPKPAAASGTEPASPADSALPPWSLAALATLAVLVIALFAYFAFRRRPALAAMPARLAPTPEPAREPAASLPDLDLAPPEHRAELASDAPLATSVPGTDPELLRRRYLAERFPEIANGTLDIANPDAVVKGARLFYEDGSLPRAVELLQFAIEERPGEVKPWLALFEIFRLENLAGEFGTLASRFRDQHGANETWRKVQFVGREIDPQNPLYRDGAFDGLETVGHPDAARARAVAFDPLAENWLNAPMDFTSDALAAELRAALLSDAGLTESDLIPNPMPALKQVEMFTVA